MKSARAVIFTFFPFSISTLATLALCLATFAVATPAARAAVNSAENQRGLILTPDESHAMTLMHAVNRLRAKAPMPLDLADSWTDNRVQPANYDMTIVLGVTGPTAAQGNATNPSLALLDKAWSGHRPNPADPDPAVAAAADEAWALKTISTNPLILACNRNGIN